jgi:hypothetical protein
MEKQESWKIITQIYSDVAWVNIDSDILVFQCTTGR